MRIASTALLALLLAAPGLPGPADPEPIPTAESVTDRGRSLIYIVDQLLRGTSEEKGPRTLLLLIDPSVSLRTARFTDVLAERVEHLGEDVPAVSVWVVGDRSPVVFPPTRDPDKVVAAVREALAKPRDEVRDVVASVRGATGALRGREGRREIALVSLENGDGESDLEATAALLARSGVVLHVVGRGAFLADAYWARRSTSQPGGMEMHGPEGPYDDLPWGWVFQRTTVNEAVSSGFGLFGPARLAHRSGGRYYLYSPSAPGGSRCDPYGSCRLCAADHADCGTVYATHRLRDLAPPLGSRLEARQALARDALFRVVLEIWGQASGAGLLISRPPLRPGPGLLREERRRIGNSSTWLSGNSFGSQARRAEKLASKCTGLARKLEAAIQSTARESTTPRTIAIAETTRMHLLVTRLNLRLFQAFCQQAPQWMAGPEEPLLPPEKPLFDARRFDYRGVSYTSQCFCHGTERLSRLEIPGLADLGADRDEAFAAVERLRARYEGTPFGRAARLTGIAIFNLTVPGRATTTTRPIPGTDEEGTSTGTSRPPRAGASGGGDAGGTSTGDK